MIKINEAIIVEGKYDKIKLSNIVDALIIETNGFGIFKDKDRLNFIRKVADEKGIILLTDSDHAGQQIRNYISKGIPKDKIIQIYIPEIYGKEKRKKEPSKEGKLGVEGIDEEILCKLLEDANISYDSSITEDRITNYDLYELGYSGGNSSKEKRKELLKSLDLPEFLSTNSLLSYLNCKMSLSEFKNYITTI